MVRGRNIYSGSAAMNRQVVCISPLHSLGMWLIVQNALVGLTNCKALGLGTKTRTGAYSIRAMRFAFSLNANEPDMNHFAIWP